MLGKSIKYDSLSVYQYYLSLINKECTCNRLKAPQKLDKRQRVSHVNSICVVDKSVPFVGALYPIGPINMQEPHVNFSVLGHFCLVRINTCIDTRFRIPIRYLF